MKVIASQTDIQVSTSRQVIVNVPEIREYYSCELFLKNLVENKIQITLKLVKTLTVLRTGR